MDASGIGSGDAGGGLPAFLRPVSGFDQDFSFEYDTRQDSKKVDDPGFGLRGCFLYLVKSIPCLQTFVNFVSRLEWPQRPEPNEDDWINKPTTSLGFGGVILLNSVFMAIETELHGEPKSAFIVIESFFLLVFSVEIVLR